MQAIRVRKFGEPDVMRVEEAPDLQVGDDQVVVQIQANGVNPVDTYIRSGTYAVKPDLPYTPGSDAAGTVSSIGSGIHHVQVGDRVYVAGSLTGSYASQALCTAAQVHPLPDNISFAQGAGVYVPFATAYRGLFQRAKGVAGETVLVHGASGGVGTAAVQLARAAGLTVIGTAGSERGKTLVAEQGAHHVVNHHDADSAQQIMDITNGTGVNVILEMLADVNLDKDLRMLAHGGRVVVIGNRGTIEINPRDAMARDAAILGMVLLLAPPEDVAGIHAGLRAGLENGSLNPVVGQEFPLADAPRAHVAVMEPGAYGKIVLIP
ncbi:MAG TPA: NADPH:quinone reductase [candidate division Zixibacteria bacterium]|jgi:NADPH2:quinone reductase|nr:NADPH:quinone reductase [candidate division Zixibacteria bacterium]